MSSEDDGCSASRGPGPRGSPCPFPGPWRCRTWRSSEPPRPGRPSERDAPRLSASSGRPPEGAPASAPPASSRPAAEGAADPATADGLRFVELSSSTEPPGLSPDARLILALSISCSAAEISTSASSPGPSPPRARPGRSGSAVPWLASGFVSSVAVVSKILEKTVVSNALYRSLALLAVELVAPASFAEGGSASFVFSAGEPSPRAVVAFSAAALEGCVDPGVSAASGLNARASFADVGGPDAPHVRDGRSAASASLRRGPAHPKPDGARWAPDDSVLPSAGAALLPPPVEGGPASLPAALRSTPSCLSPSLRALVLPPGADRPDDDLIPSASIVDRSSAVRSPSAAAVMPANSS
mmetsp:Transcript_5922/g.13320  ORF Transcript_5922/g.13320 Transcript_5922/m.13320 type:complete len:356 (+) Transcript_5922:1204-2271(+)